jgi:predicted nucleic acid-binding protein
LVPLLAEEPLSRAFRVLLRRDRHVVVWVLTRVEVVSAVRRKVRLAELDAAGSRGALQRLEALAARWTEVDAVVPVREKAERVLAVHALHAADALQLGAVQVLADGVPRRARFVTADARLAAAAEAEGFAVECPAA